MVETKPEPPEESPHHNSWLSASKTSNIQKQASQKRSLQLPDLWGTVHCCGYGRSPILCVPWITERHTEVPCQVPTSMLSPSRYHSSEMYLMTLDVIICCLAWEDDNKQLVQSSDHLSNPKGKAQLSFSLPQLHVSNQVQVLQFRFCDSTTFLLCMSPATKKLEMSPATLTPQSWLCKDWMHQTAVQDFKHFNPWFVTIPVD